MPHDGGSAKNQGFSRDFRHKRVYLMLMRRFEQELGKTDEKMEWESSDSHSVLRRHLLEFLIDSAQQLLVRPIVKYTALSFFADRFFPSVSRSRKHNLFDVAKCERNFWLLNPLTESNLQLFALVSIWVSSKLHETRPLSVKSLKSLGDMLISDQCFTTRDFAMAERLFLEMTQFDIGASQVAFIFLEELLMQFRELSKVGSLVSLEVCMEIMDLLYEKEQTSMLFSSPHALAASILVAAYFFTVPKQQWEFPLLPWVCHLL
ncbi:cyclin-J18 isoform X2 [Dendrobium catenatum]|uniref:cyclin-J18 isoform X2 n=1 Tax=Dendrobium catenatum TaxID=906689 RepID=UPI0009F4003F|nr:cyclin-J18 isoform X2 [Dendrobium catenatum]